MVPGILNVLLIDSYHVDAGGGFGAEVLSAAG